MPTLGAAGAAAVVTINEVMPSTRLFRLGQGCRRLLPRRVWTTELMIWPASATTVASLIAGHTDEAPIERRLGVDRFAGEEHLECPFHADRT